MTRLAQAKGALCLRMVFSDRKLRFSCSTGEESFHAIGPVLNASLLSDENGKHWSLTGTFVALACQDLTGSRLELFKERTLVESLDGGSEGKSAPVIARFGPGRHHHLRPEPRK